MESFSLKIHNHVENSSAIGNKKGLLFYLKSYTEMFEEDIEELIPTTVHLKDE